MSNSIAKRARGALLGLAVGDVLGGWVEGWRPWQVRAVFDSLTQIPDSPPVAALIDQAEGADREGLIRYLRPWRPAGVHSDDTQQALLLAYSLIERGSLDVQDLVDRFVRFSQPRDEQLALGVFRGYGRGFGEQMASLDPASDLKRCGRPSAGNGAAMRIAPLGLRLRGDLHAVARAAVEASLPTHCEVRALAAAATMAYAVGRLVEADRPLDPVRFLYETADAAADIEDLIADEYGDYVHVDSRDHRHQFSRSLLQLDGMWRLGIGDAVSRIGEFASDKTAYRIRHGNAGFCLCSVPTSFFYLLRFPESFEDAIVAAVEGGGDADTIGAMTGALAGALHGAAGIPDRWLAGLRCRELLEQAADALADPEAPAPALPDLPDLYEVEKALTLETLDFQRGLQAELDRQLDAIDADADGSDEQ